MNRSKDPLALPTSHLRRLLQAGILPQDSLPAIRLPRPLPSKPVETLDGKNGRHGQPAFVQIRRQPEREADVAIRKTEYEGGESIFHPAIRLTLED